MTQKDKEMGERRALISTLPYCRSAFISIVDRLCRCSVRSATHTILVFEECCCCCCCCCCIVCVSVVSRIAHLRSIGRSKQGPWRLKVAEGGGPWLRSLNLFGGRQVWEFDEHAGDAAERVAVDKARAAFAENRFEQRHSSDLLMRLQFAKENPLSELPAQLKIENRAELTEETVTTTLRRALRFYSTIQAHDGHWPGDYGGPMFLMPGLVIVLYDTGSLNTVLTPAHQKEMRRYLYNHQKKDGGWGLLIEGHSTMFGSVLTYVTLRILGDGPEGGEYNALQRGRNWIHEHGGATYITSWGKFWLSLLGVFDWSGNNPLPPEIWMLPYFLPLHPGRTWCHCRMVYLPMSYIYGNRFTGKLTELVKALRERALERWTLPRPLMRIVEQSSPMRWDVPAGCRCFHDRDCGLNSVVKGNCEIKGNCAHENVECTMTGFEIKGNCAHENVECTVMNFEIKGHFDLQVSESALARREGGYR